MYYSYDHFVLKWKLVTTYKAFRTVPGAYLVCVILLATLIALINIICVRILIRYEQMQGHLKQSRVKTMQRGGETSDLSVISQTLAQFFPWLFGGMLSQAGQEANLSPHLKVRHSDRRPLQSHHEYFPLAHMGWCRGARWEEKVESGCPRSSLGRVGARASLGDRLCCRCLLSVWGQKAGVSIFMLRCHFFVMLWTALVLDTFSPSFFHHTWGWGHRMEHRETGICKFLKFENRALQIFCLLFNKRDEANDILLQLVPLWSGDLSKPSRTFMKNKGSNYGPCRVGCF